MRTKRDRRLHILLNDEEYDVLAEMAYENETTMADVLRRLLREEQRRFEERADNSNLEHLGTALEAALAWQRRRIR